MAKNKSPVPPWPDVLVVLPAALPSARAVRFQNQALKEAAVAVLAAHHHMRVPLHFVRTNRDRYRHRKRRPAYLARKRRRYRSITDLVKTRETRIKMLQEGPHIRVSGAAFGRGNTPGPGITGTLTMKFPSDMRDNPQNAKGMKMADMRDEIGQVLPQEEQHMSVEFANAYGKGMRNRLASSPKMRLRLAQLGHTF